MSDKPTNTKMTSYAPDEDDLDFDGQDGAEASAAKQSQPYVALNDADSSDALDEGSSWEDSIPPEKANEKIKDLMKGGAGALKKASESSLVQRVLAKFGRGSSSEMSEDEEAELERIMFGGEEPSSDTPESERSKEPGRMAKLSQGMGGLARRVRKKKAAADEGDEPKAEAPAVDAVSVEEDKPATRMRFHGWALPEQVAEVLAKTPWGKPRRVVMVSNERRILRAPKSSVLVLCGDMVPASTQRTAGSKTLIEQEPRKTANVLGAMGKAETPDGKPIPKEVFIWLRTNVAQGLAKRGGKIAFAFDQFLKIGQAETKQGHLLMLTGGFFEGQSESTSVDIWRFVNGRLCAFSQRRIAARNSENYLEELRSIIRGEEDSHSDFPFTKIMIYKDLDLDSVLPARIERLSFEEVFSRPALTKIRSIGKRGAASRYLIPAFMVLMAIGLWGGVYVYDNQILDKNNAAFKKELRSFDDDPRIANSQIKRFEAYKNHFDQQAAKKALGESLRRVALAVANAPGYPYLRALDISTEPSDKGDFYMELTLPLGEGASAITSGRPVLTSISNELNATLRVIDDRVSREQKEGRTFNTAIFKIAGFWGEAAVEE